MFAKSLLSLSVGGRQVAISVPPGQPTTTFDLFDFYRRELRLFGLNTLNTSSQRAGEILRSLQPAFESSALAPPQVKPFKLSDAQQAYEAVNAGDKGGKAVILPWN